MTLSAVEASSDMDSDRANATICVLGGAAAPQDRRARRR